MILLVLIVVFASCTAIFAWSLWNLRKAIYKLVSFQQDIQQSNMAMGQEFNRQVSEIKQNMGMVVNGLQTMGQQVHNLNMLTGNIETDELQALQNGQPGIQQIMIEIMPMQDYDVNNKTSEQQAISLDEMPQELQERIRIFHSIYKTILSSDRSLPSFDKPELN